MYLPYFNIKYAYIYSHFDIVFVAPLSRTISIYLYVTHPTPYTPPPSIQYPDSNTRKYEKTHNSRPAAKEKQKCSNLTYSLPNKVYIYLSSK